MNKRLPHAPDAGVPVAPTVPGTYRPLASTAVELTGGFWGDRQVLNQHATLPHAAAWIDKLGWIENFLPPDQRRSPERRGRLFTDSDVYKLLEGLVWESARSGDETCEQLVGEITAAIAQSVENDGYLNTYYGRWGTGQRYSDMAHGHELYCYGHLIQAGVARLRTAGSDELTALVLRVADHVCDEFGPGGRDAVCGHPEIELALVELYRTTGEQRYLETAAVLVERRGRGLIDEPENGAAYFQDDLPVREATVLRGHAVRALYLASGAADVARESGDSQLFDAVVTQWENTVARRTYLTGGMGSRHHDEAFGDDYELPADRAYAETCAALAHVQLSWRLLLATGDVRYADQIERALYNVVAASTSADGTSFFYTNTLQQRALSPEPTGEAESFRAATGLRAAWFSVPCCPTNLGRTLSSLGGYLATTDSTGVQVHQYASGRISTRGDVGQEIVLDVETHYPYEAEIAITVAETPGTSWTLSLRVPAWADGATISVNGDTPVAVGPGVQRLERGWVPGDVVVLRLPLELRWTTPDPRIDAVRGCVALERGPLVYCAERLADEDPQALLLAKVALPAEPTPVQIAELPGVPAYRLSTEPVAAAGGAAGGAWPYRGVGTAPSSPEAVGPITLIPYYAWGNRGPSTMRVWIPVTYS